MAVTEVEAALHWRCRSCGLEWFDVGRGFPGSRYSECLRCGSDALEDDATAAPASAARVHVPGPRRFVPPR